MHGPTEGPWRIRRGGTLGLVCATLPLLGHDVGSMEARAGFVAAVAFVLLAFCIRLASHRLSFPALAGVLVVSQMAIHAVLGVTVDAHTDGQVWTYHAHVAFINWASGAQQAGTSLASNLVVTLAAVLILYALERNIWTWFRVAAVRLLIPVPPIPLLPATDVPLARTDSDSPIPQLAPIPRSRGRRAPPSELAF